jgi:dTDP-4-dehydrorhamnose reductase
MTNFFLGFILNALQVNSYICKKISTMNVLITGSNGQLGTEMRVLAEKHDCYTYFFTDIDELDISSEQAVMTYVTSNRIDVIVNCAAYTAVDSAEDNQELCNRLNNIAAGYLARAAQSRRAAMIQVSTDYVFDGSKHTPYTEEDAVCPVSVYGTTKLAGEESVLKLCEKTAVIRTAWLYSAYGNNFVKTMIRLGRERNILGVIFDQIGTPTYANDLAQVIYTIIHKGIVRGIYHFSNEGVCSWYDFTVSIHRLAGITGCKVKPIHTADYPTKAARPLYSVLDKIKIKKVYGIEIPHWEESLGKCVESNRDKCNIYGM